MAGKKKPKPAKRPTGRPATDPAKIAIGLRHLDASEPELAVKNSGTSLATLYRAKAKRDARAGAASASPMAPTPPPPPDPIASPDPVAAAPSGPPLPAAKLSELAGLVARLPLAQQDAVVAALPLDRLRLAALARGLASHREAAAAVVRELRAVSL